ncbi:3-hydroxyacyl-CoA dehydrogenase family protein [Marinobacter sp.]|uniref:3-hydroxyacyl-CoA dehydrogenase family protein n=1 Tax=Marinobacter sp. TaxID=50741 RepID=UPI003A5C0EBA
MRALVNEVSNLLAGHVAQRASDIDVLYTAGYGFPSWRKGQGFYAQERGLENVYRRICYFRDAFDDDRWRPSELLEQLVSEQKAPADWESAS